MSTWTQQAMTNHHGTGTRPGLSWAGLGWAGVGETLHLWRERYRSRRELTQWTERELRDIGISWSDVMREAEKPFWRA